MKIVVPLSVESVTSNLSGTNQAAIIEITLGRDVDPAVESIPRS